MYFLIYAMEELYTYFHNDLHRLLSPPISSPETVSGNSLLCDRYSTNFVEYKVFAIPDIDRSR